MTVEISKQQSLDHLLIKNNKLWSGIFIYFHIHIIQNWPLK